MRWVDAAFARLRLLLFREEVEQRMDEEFRFHLDMETERLVREAGVHRREARRRARAAFGGVEAHKDAVRDGRGGWAWRSGLQLGVARDIRDGFRSLARRPAFTAVAVLSLALGIGANTAIFSLVNAVILRDSPVERPEEVVDLYLHQASFEFGTLSYPDFEDVRDGTAEVFSDIAASHFLPLTIDRGPGGGVGLAPAEAVTGSYFPLLGIEAAVGRTLLPSDDVSRGGHPVVMLDHRYWQSAFAGDPDVVGREMRAGLFLRSFQRVQSVDPGFGREPTALMTFLTPATRFTPDEARVYTRRLLDRFRALPGVEAVGAVSNLHLNPLSQSSSDFNVDGFEPPTDHGAFIADRVEVEPGFFEAAGIEIVRGRNFNDADRPDTRPVVIVSEAMARRFWKDGDAVGRLVRRRGDAPAGLVVGVASDAKVRIHWFRRRSSPKEAKPCREEATCTYRRTALGGRSLGPVPGFPRTALRPMRSTPERRRRGRVKSIS